MSSEPETKRAKMENSTSTAAGMKKEDEKRDINPDFSNEEAKALEELDKVQTELDNLNENASEEILKVEQKYNQLRKPHFSKRNECIKQIPNFWITVFINHPQISNILEEEEEECLNYLTAVEIQEFEDIKAGYKLKFAFDPNPYFENEEIVKEYNWSGAEPHCTTTEIKWKSGKQKALVNGAGKNMVDKKSFFKWLCEESDPMADDIAEIIKDDIWQNPIQYFVAPDVEAADEEIGDEEEHEEGNEDAEDNEDVAE